MRTKDEILQGEPSPLFLLKCKTDFKFFCEQCLGVTDFGGIHPFQLKWLDLANKHKRLVIEAPAGHSKSEVMGAMYPLWLMLIKKDMKILLVNKTLEQGRANLLARIKKYIANNELLMEIFTPDDYKATWNMSEIKTKNGHWCKNVPYNENIRGYRADLIICDEVDSYEDVNIFFEHVTSRLFPDGQMILISTPVGPTRLIGQLKERSKAGLIDKYFFERTTSLVDMEGKIPIIENQEDINQYIAIWPEMWSVKKLYEAWGEQGKANWTRNYMTLCLGEIDDAVFPIKNILNCFDYNRGFNEECFKDAMYFIGADFAISEGPRADFDAYIVIEKLNGQYIIKTIETHKGWQRPEKVTRLEELYKRYSNSLDVFLVVDESNMGTMVMNDLRNKGIPVIGQKFHSSARTLLLTTLASVFSGRGIIIPRDSAADDESIKYSELKDQLTGFRRKGLDNNSGNRDTIESKAPHDDIAMALAMAINEAIQHEEMGVMPISG
jgi:hypothetical protein